MFKPTRPASGGKGLWLALRAAIVNRVAGNAAVYLVATMVNAGIPFLLLPFLTRWLGPAEFGLAALFFATTNVVVVFVGLNAHGTINVAYIRVGPHALAPQTGAAVGIAAAMGGFLLFLATLLPHRILSVTGLPPSWVWIVALAATLQAIQMALVAVFQARRQPLQFAVTQIGYALLVAIFIIVLVGWLDFGWQGRALAQVVAAGLVCGIALAVLTANGGISWSIADWRIREALTFGVPLLPHAIGGVIMANIDRLALASVAGPEMIGHYFLSVQIASIPLIFATALSQAWSPWLFENLKDDNSQNNLLIVRATYAIFFIIIFISGIIGLFSPWIVKLIAGPGYESAILLLRVLAPAYAFVAMYHFITGFLFYEERTGLLSIITVSVAVVQFCLCSALAVVVGPLGVALGTLAAYFIYFLLVWGFANYIHPLPWALGLFSSCRPRKDQLEH